MRYRLVGDVELGKDGSKWKHGYIPENAAAVAIKDHKKYLSSDARKALPATKLKAHAEAHTAAAARARTPESKASHLKEAKAATGEIAKRKAAKAKAKATMYTPKTFHPAAPKPSTKKVLGSLEDVKAKAADPKTSLETKKALARAVAAKREKVLKIANEAKKAQKFIDHEIATSPQHKLKPAGKFFQKLYKIAPWAKAGMERARASEALDAIRLRQVLAVTLHGALAPIVGTAVSLAAAKFGITLVDLG